MRKQNKDKTKQAAGKERPNQNIIAGSGLNSQDKNNTAHDNTHKQHVNSRVAW